MGENCVNWNKPMFCERCGNLFIAHAPNAKYCPSCRPIMASERHKRDKAEREARQARLKAQKAMQKYKGLDDAVKECRDKGISYADAQKAKTLSMIPRIEL